MKFLLNHQETGRLRFRKLEHSDFKIWMELFKDEETTKLLGMSEFKNPEECCEKWFEWTFHRYENDLGGQNALICKETNQLVGQCGLLVRDVENKFELEIAYSILPNFRKMGFALESAKKCKEFAFENNFHERLISMIFPENEKSKKVAAKNGMTLNKKVIYNHKEMDIFAITKEEFNEIRQ
ncbi:GNAT family N-acetyltransferase [Chryseobacterium aahli]|uniref:GNAT family N-acetyltransferase n=1 Tax=Chryseobacterium aahli TaxID=1278643 RepID=UPI001F604E67|nr:GNAT family N-acetyltransferase [Chryseobacterium aahli]MCI3935842.1 GNAT family N-acetyltransferase [Chryseobacterium aahli]